MANLGIAVLWVVAHATILSTAAWTGKFSSNAVIAYVAAYSIKG